MSVGFMQTAEDGKSTKDRGARDSPFLPFCLIIELDLDPLLIFSCSWIGIYITGSPGSQDFELGLNYTMGFPWFSLIGNPIVFFFFLKAKSVFNDRFSVSWCFLSSKGHVFVRYYISMGLCFVPGKHAWAVGFRRVPIYCFWCPVTLEWVSVSRPPEGHAVSESYCS